MGRSAGLSVQLPVTPDGHAAVSLANCTSSALYSSGTKVGLALVAVHNKNGRAGVRGEGGGGPGGGGCFHSSHPRTRLLRIPIDFLILMVASWTDNVHKPLTVRRRSRCSNTFL